MPLAHVAAGGNAVDEDPTPGPRRVQPQRHPEVACSPDDDAGGQAVEQDREWAESVPARVQLVYAGHEERGRDCGRPEADRAGQREEQVSAIKEVFERGQKKGQRPESAILQDGRAMQGQ